MNQKTKKIILAVVVIVIAFILFQNIWGGKNSSDSSLVTDNAVINQSVDGQAVLLLLNRLNKVSLDSAIFSNKAFSSLVSFEQTIPDQAIQRPNPFAPIGTDRPVSVVNSTSSPKTK